MRHFTIAILVLVVGLMVVDRHPFNVGAQTKGGKVSGDSSQSVNPTVGPPARAYRVKYDYDGSNKLIYKGWAASQNRRTEWTVQSGTLTSVVDAVNTATITFNAANPHCLEIGNMVTLSGFSTDPDLNDTYRIASVVSPAGITVTTANVTDATYTGNGILYTTAPRTCDQVWVIQRSTNVTAGVSDEAWAEGSSTNFNFVWDNRINYGYQ